MSNVQMVFFYLRQLARRDLSETCRQIYRRELKFFLEQILAPSQVKTLPADEDDHALIRKAKVFLLRLLKPYKNKEVKESEEDYSEET